MNPNWITATIVAVIMIIGIFGNVLVCLAYYKYKEIRTFSGLLVCNLAIADVLQCLDMIFIVVSLIYNRWVFGDILCQVAGVTNICFINVSILSLSLISINRYAVVIKGQQLAFFSKRNTRILIACCWALPLLIGMAPVFGWSNYGWVHGKYMCTLDFSYSLSYSITLMATAMFIPFIIMAYCNVVILRAIWKNRRKKESSIKNERRKKENTRVSIMIFVVIVTFFLFYIPIVTVTIIDMAKGPEYVLPMWIDSVTVVIAMLNHANNPFIYGIMNYNFRRAFKTMLCRKKRRRRRIAPAAIAEIEQIPAAAKQLPEQSSI